MERRPRFGPAGVPPIFRVMRANLEDVPRLLHEEGLDAFEYEAVRWGKKPQVREEEAERLGLQAKKHDVWLSLHASYFINFSGQRAIVEASKQRLVACATAAEWMDAHTAVFHPGAYGNNTPQTALKMCSGAMQEVVQIMAGLGLRKVKIGPEMMGKVNQVGTLDEVLTLCERVDHTQLVVDWAHLHARDGGRFKTVEDFRQVVEHIENRLGTETVRNMHCHFTKIEYSEKGEKRHHTLEEPRFGPDFRLLAKVIVEFDMRPVIISESPFLDLDAMKMRDMFREELDKG